MEASNTNADKLMHMPDAGARGSLATAAASTHRLAQKRPTRAAPLTGLLDRAGR
jgi:hypothetical protein